MPLSPCGAGPFRWGAPSARPPARAVPVGKEAVPWRRRWRRARSGPGPRRSPCWGRRLARPAALTVSRPGGHLPSVPVLSSRCAPGAGWFAAAFAKALLRKLGSCGGAVKQICRCSLCYRILAFVPRSRASVREDQPRKRGRKKILCLFGL